MKKQIFSLAMLMLFIAVVAGCKDAPEDIYRATVIEKVMIEADKEIQVYWVDTSTREPLEDFPGVSTDIKRAINKGDEALAQNRIPAAVQYYKEAYDLGLEEPTLVFRIAWLLQKDDPLRAAWYYTVSNDLYKEKNGGKDLKHALFNSASCYLMVGKFKDEYYYDEELSKDYRIKDFKLMKRKGALTLLTELLEFDRTYLHAYYNRAHCYYYLGYYQEALNDLKVFLTKGGERSTFIAPALSLVTTCENELRIPASEKFKITARPKPSISE